MGEIWKVYLQNANGTLSLSLSDMGEEEEEEEFFNHYKNDLERHAHTPSGVAGADLSAHMSNTY